MDDQPNYLAPVNTDPESTSATDYNSMIVGADNFNLESGQKSWLESVGDAGTYGLHGAWTSGINSFINTGVQIGNFFGGDFEKADTYQDLLDSDPNAAAYYQQHRAGVDLAGFIGGSLIPGFGGVKALQLAKTGKGLLPTSLGLFSDPRERLLKQTLSLIEQGAPSVDSVVRMNKYKIMALGVGDQAIQAAAWETAVEATMGAAPTLDNQDWKDITFNIATGAVLGGAVGGIWDAFGAHGLYKKAQIARDVAVRPYESTTNLGRGDFLAGDRVVSLLESLDAIPVAPTEDASRIARETYDKAIKGAKIELGKVSDDPEVANSMLDRLLQQRDSGTISKDDLYERLSGLSKLQRVTEADSQQPEIFYINKTGADATGFITNVPPTETSQSYKLRNPQIQPKVMSVADTQTAAEAFQRGADIWLNPELVPIVNPSAVNLQRTLKPGFSNTAKTEGAPLIINLRSGVVSNTAVPVIGDLAESGSIKLSRDLKVLNVGDKTFSYSPTSFSKDLYGEEYLQANGRFIWAARRATRQNDVINLNDLARLDALALEIQAGKLDQKVLETATVQDGAGERKGLKTFLETNQLQDIIENTKRANLYEYTESTYGKELGSNGLPVGKDLRELSARFNVPEQWLQDGMPKISSLDQIVINPEEWARPNYAKAIYSVGDPVKDVDGMIARGMPAMIGRISRAKDLAQTAWVNYAKDWAEQFPDIDPRFSQTKANSLGSGPTAFGFNNPDYNTAGELWSSVGAVVHNMKLDAIQKTRDFLAQGNLAITNSEAGGVNLRTITNILRGADEKYVLVPNSNYMVLRKLADHVELAGDRMGFKATAEANTPVGYNLRIAGDQGTEILAKGRYAAYKLNEDVYGFLDSSTQRNDLRLSHDNNFRSAQGITKTLELGTVYAPPIDTKKYNFWALVREPQGNGASSSSVSSLTAANEGDLAAKVAKAKAAGYEVYTKNDIKLHHQVLGDYDYNMNMSENVVDSELKKKGVLSDYSSSMKTEDVLDEWNTWHDKQETRLLRNMTELKYAQQFAELRDLGKNYVDLATSRTGKVGAYTGKTAENPYDDYIKTALDLPKTGEYRLWNEANEKVEAFFDSAFAAAKNVFGKASKGEVTWEEANNISQKMGLGKPFVNAADYLEQQGMLAPKPYLRNFIQGVNGVMAATTLSLDAINSLINVISTPILLSHEISSLRKNFGTPEGLARLEQLLTMPLPGDASKRIPSTAKLIYNAVNASYGESSKELFDSYAKTGLDISLLRQRNEMLGKLAVANDADAKTLTARLKEAVSLGETLTGNKLAESYTRFIPAHVMGQVCDALGVEDAAVRLAMQRTFVNRVQGNYIASQRPIAFQGIIGQAIGLFQTYQFNLMQQVFRSVENGDKKSLAILFGMQGSLYGVNGLPLFSAINTHIVGNAPGNTNHVDISTAVPRLVGKDVGDFLLYGGASWFTNSALYSRGDINPRQITVLPINPLDFPAITGITGFVNNIYNMGAKLNDGGNFLGTMLQGMEHNGLSRPLAGLAQVVQGYTTTNSGNLISRTSETNAIANAARILGAKPLDEGIALDALYRKTAYVAKDQARIQQLGEAVKTTFAAGGVPSETQFGNFATEYAASGGRIEHFNRFMVDAMKNSNQSNVNVFLQKIKSPVAQNMMEVMGGERLPDYTNLPVEGGVRN